MVVLATSVTTKSGKVLISRQFVPITRSRIEGLLAAFPKLLGNAQQHTFIETSSVRYLYQKMDDLFLVVITNKSSNIVEDLETLRIISRVVPEYCGPQVNEKAIVENGFELIFAFDEVVSLGYKESVTLDQIRTYTELDSHEERIFSMIEKNKEREALEEAKRRMKEIDRERREREKLGLPSYAGVGSVGGGSGSGGMSSVSGYPPNQAFIERTPEKSYKQPEQEQRKGRKGLQLGKKPQNQNIMEKLREEGEMNVAPETIGNEESQEITNRDGVDLAVLEQLQCSFESDGSLKQMQLQGEFTVTVHEPSASRSLIQLQVDSKDIQFRVHPNIDRDSFLNNDIITMADPDKAYPLETPTSVLRWRIQSQKDKDVPLKISCWTAKVGNGKSVTITVEYELGNGKYELTDINVIIPIVGKSSPAVNNISEGSHRFDTRSNLFIWNIPTITADNVRGSLEIEVEQWDSSESSWMFPIKVNFTSRTTLAEIKVVKLDDLEGNSLPFRQRGELSVSQFTVG